MKHFENNFKVFLFLLVLTISIFGEGLSDTEKFFETAGISREQLSKVDIEIQNIIYSGLTTNLRSIKSIPHAAGNPVIRRINNQQYISVFIKSTNPHLLKSKIETKGGNVSNIISDILIADLPVVKLTEIVFDENIRRVETSRYQESLLDTSLTFINVDQVHSGESLPMPYKGEGVIVGVVDSGIDWTHPAFNNESGNRILYLWDMSDDTNPPAEFDYGTEYTKEDLDQQNSNQIDDDGHGTHVASIAAGNAGGSQYLLDGVAPKADIVFVKGYREYTSYANTDVINGCDYIFKKAEQLGKAAVINLSIGGLLGQIGMSLYEQALTNLVAPGRLIVASAGNGGGTNAHLQYEMSGSSIEEASETYWSPYDDRLFFTYIYGYPQSEDYSFGIKVYSADLSNVLYTSPAASFNQDPQSIEVVINDTKIGTLTMGGYPGIIDESIHGEPFLYLRLTNFFKLDVSNYVFSLYTYGSSTLNAWIWNGSFSSDSDPGNRIFPGDDSMTLQSPSAAFNVFSIGAFTTKTEWTDINGNSYYVEGTINDRAPFSSVGPLRDGRIKPDFLAPGYLVAAANSKDAENTDEVIINNKTVIRKGTSMAAPHFTGVIGLLLEQKPDLTYDEAFDILKNSSISDDITGEVPNNEFGYGRIDAQAALQQLVTSVDDDETLINEFSLSQNYPNPFNPSTTINYSLPDNEFVSIKVYDILGNEITTLVNDIKSAGTHRVAFDGSNLSSGVYFYRISAGNFHDVRKMMFVK